MVAKQSWWRRFVPQRKSTEGVAIYMGATFVAPAWKAAQQVKEGLEKNSVVYACINLIATSMTEARWVLATGQGDKRKELDTHPVLDVLKRPRPKGGWSLWIRDYCQQLLSTGNAFVHGIGAQQGKWTELQILPTSMVGINVDARGQVTSYMFNNRDRIKVEDIMHVRLFPSEDQPYLGLSPLQAGALIVDTDNEAQSWNRDLMKNRGKPESLIKFNRTLSEEERARVKSEIEIKFSGAANAGRPAVIEGDDFEYVPLSQTMVELDYSAGQTALSRRICQLYGVPPELIGDVANKTYSNQKEARLALVEQVVFSLLNLLRDELNPWLVKPYGEDLELDFDEDSFGVIAEKRREVYDGLNNTTFLSCNEKRIAAGYEPVQDDPDADVPMDLLSSRALSRFAEPPIPGEEEDPAEEEEEPVEDEEEEDGEDDEPPALPKKKSTDRDPGYLNLDTEEKRVSFWRAGDLKRRAFEIVARKAMASHFRDEGRAVVKAFKSGGAEAADSKIAARVGSVQAILSVLYTRVGDWFFGEVESGIGAKSRKDVPAARREMRAYFGGRARDTSRLIQDSTRGSIRGLIRRFLEGGSSLEDTASAIESAYEDFSDIRVDTIASTEVNQSANAGSIFGAKATEKVLLKEWITQRDDRVRSHARGDQFDHVGADGQAVGLDDLFQVSGETMEFPADSGHGASAGNVVNCRCFVAFKEAS